MPRLGECDNRLFELWVDLPRPAMVGGVANRELGALGPRGTQPPSRVRIVPACPHDGAAGTPDLLEEGQPGLSPNAEGPLSQWNLAPGWAHAAALRRRDCRSMAHARAPTLRASTRRRPIGRASCREGGEHTAHGSSLNSKNA